jgi:hypothetical protein
MFGPNHNWTSLEQKINFWELDLRLKMPLRILKYWWTFVLKSNGHQTQNRIPKIRNRCEQFFLEKIENRAFLIGEFIPFVLAKFTFLSQNMEMVCVFFKTDSVAVRMQRSDYLWKHKQSKKT